MDGIVHSRMKGVDIIINNDTWLKIASLKDEGQLSHQPDCLQNKWIRKTEMFKDFMRYRGRYKKEKGFLFKWLDKEEKVVALIIGRKTQSNQANSQGCLSTKCNYVEGTNKLGSCLQMAYPERRD